MSSSEIRPLTGLLCDTEAGLLDEIRADPEAHEPRLVYADFLEETGDARRAEFLRASLRFPAPLAVEQAIRQWSLDWAMFGLFRPHFDRGLLTRCETKVTAQTLDLLPHLARVIAREPLAELRTKLDSRQLLAHGAAVARLQAADWPIRVDYWFSGGARSQEAARDPGMEAVTSLHLKNNLDRIVGCRNLSRVTRLGLVAASEDSLRPLSRLACLEQITHLTLETAGMSRLAAGALRTVLHSGRWSSLRVLELGVGIVHDDTLEELAGCGHLPPLDELRLAAPHLSAASARRLVELPFLPEGMRLYWPLVTRVLKAPDLKRLRSRFRLREEGMFDD